MFTCYTIIQRIASYIRERMTMTLFWGGTRRSMKERNRALVASVTLSADPSMMLPRLPDLGRS